MPQPHECFTIPAVRCRTITFVATAAICEHAIVRGASTSPTTHNSGPGNDLKGGEIVTASLWRWRSSWRICCENAVRAARRCSRLGMAGYPKVMLELAWQLHEQPDPPPLAGV